jgi:pimeloyl-ACP methyl ester carboxylesterase
MNITRFAARDGLRLAYRETADTGRPLILLHGFAGGSSLWTEHGIADAIAEHGIRVIMPDFRGHGDSPRPHDPAAYPPDILADDGLALIDHLGFNDHEYDLAGYSLGGRIVARMLARGATPRRAIIAGQGLAKVTGPQGGGDNHRLLTALVNGTEFAPDSPEAKTAYWIKKLGADPQALLHVLASLVPTREADLRRITTETLVAIGQEDERADADQLAALLPHAQYIRVPGNHGTAIATPEFSAAIAKFLAA